MEKQLKKSSVQVTESNDGSIVFKVVGNGPTSKKAYKRKEAEQNSSIRVHYFDEKDFQRLQEIRKTIQSNKAYSGSPGIKGTFKAVKDFFMK